MFGLVGLAGGVVALAWLVQASTAGAGVYGWALEAAVVALLWERWRERSGAAGEESAGGAVLPLAIMGASKKVLYAQLANKLPLAAFEECLRVGVAGCAQVYEKVENVVRERAHALVAAKGTALA